jgi:uncharacterized damage-inducible protein DinB
LAAINQLILLAEYNQLMNRRQYAAAEKLTTADLCENKGAFFKSVLGTLNHIMIGDIIWLQRFATHPSSSESLLYISQLEKPESLESILFMDLGELRAARKKIDEIIVEWVKRLSDTHINECITYRDMAGNLFSKPFASLINHLFLHQVHHRGQVTTLLSQSGIDFGETDLIEIINECSA